MATKPDPRSRIFLIININSIRVVVLFSTHFIRQCGSFAQAVCSSRIPKLKVSENSESPNPEVWLNTSTYVILAGKTCAANRKSGAHTKTSQPILLIQPQACSPLTYKLLTVDHAYYCFDRSVAVQSQERTPRY